ncbi:MAG: GLUG motif-containing protein, partial [Bacilli bacterium]|nr:GLUG motif-containing protein [Bacilli bacterium]MDD4718391.1 GLUG motif-containing protein [Bacilli bacterium]
MATNLNDVDNDGYLDIWYLEQLAYINTDDTTLGQKYELMRSLDFQDDEYYLDINNKVLWTEGLGWDPIGDFIFPYRQFKGSLNGNDFSIVNFFINRPTEQHIGLFAYIGNATIENLNMEDVSIIGNEATGALVGRVTGHNIMRKMYVSGNIKGVNHTGGIVGVNYDELLLNDIHSNVNINSTGNQVGGIVGLYYNSSSKFPMENLFVEGSITGVEDVGGIIGSNRGGISQANNLKSTAIVQGTINIGGVIGYSYQYTVEFINSGATGEIIGKNDSGRNIGGFIGQLIGGTIRECYSSANISNGYLSVGGFIGSIYSGTSNIIENSYATGDVNAESRVGGFLGYEYNNPL